MLSSTVSSLGGDDDDYGPGGLTCVKRLFISLDIFPSEDVRRRVMFGALGPRMNEVRKRSIDSALGLDGSRVRDRLVPLLEVYETTLLQRVWYIHH